MTISPATLALTFLGEVARLTASVRDQNGQPFNTSVTWSSGDPSVATVSGSGDVSAVGNGTTTVNASAGSAAGSVTATVQQAATQVTLVSGDGQTGTVGQALASELVAQSSDAGGAAVGNVGLSFEVTQGGGTLSATSVTTDAQGAGSSAWTLGTVSGTQEVTVSITGTSGGTATFTAEATAGAPTALVVESGDTQSGPKGFALAEPVAVKLVDEFGNGVAGETVTFAVIGGGGTVDPATATTGSGGLAQAAWTMGPAQGPNQVMATVEGLAPVTLTATAVGVSDLTVGAVTTSPAFPTPAQTVTATATITNIGDGPTILDFPVRVLVDNVEQASVTVAALAAGAGFTVNLPVGAFPGGSYTVTIEANAEGTVVESSVANNTAAAIVTFATGAPLEAGTPVANLSGTSGTLTFFTFEVPGPTAAPGRLPVASSIRAGVGAQKPGASPMEIRTVSSGLAESDFGPALAGTVSQLEVTLGGGTGDADLRVHFGSRPDDLFTWDCRSIGFTNEESCIFTDPVPGTYHIVVDGFSDFSGAMLTANTVVAFPDLTVSSLNVTPASPTLSQTVDLNIVVANVGDGPTVLDFTAQLFVDGLEAESTTVTALLTGGTTNVSFTTGPLAEGDHILAVVLDPDDVVDESNEANNTSETQVTAVDATPMVAGTPVDGLSGVSGSETFFTIEVPAAAAAPAWGPVASSIAAGVGAQKFGSRSHRPRTVDYDASAAGYTASAVITQLEVTLSGGTGDPDLYVSHGSRGSGGLSPTDWDCASEGVSTAESCIFNNPAPGTYHIMVQGFADFSGVTLLGVTSEGPVEGPFKIELEFINHGTTSQDAAFQSAADRFMTIVQGDLVDIDFSPAALNLDPDDCTEGSPAFSGLVDDLLIYVDILPIDGPFGTLAQAGPCLTRLGSGLPIMGSMQFDDADLARLEADGDMLAVVLHEMAHVLGVGVLWNNFGLLQNPSLPENGGTPGADTHFTGPLAIAAFDAAGGTGYTGGAKVPVENLLGEGSGDAHWRENPLAEELMTPSLNSGQTNPLSAITLQSMVDMGYVVDLSQADPYSKAFTSPPRAPSLGARMIDLHDDILRVPIKVVDERGRVVGVIGR